MRQIGPLAATALASLVWVQATLPSRADEPGPFPSPTPTVAPAGGNGFVAVGFSAASSNGGQVPAPPVTGATPVPFASANTNGFSLDLLGRISDNYLAALKYDNYTIHGNDNPFVSYSQGMLFYNPRATRLAVGLGYLSMQRSTASVNMNGGGFGVTLLPRFRSGASFYGSAFVFPRLSSRNGPSSLTSLDAGIIFSPPKRGGFFFRVGAFAKNGGGATFSPTQISGLTAGLGSSF